MEFNALAIGPLTQPEAGFFPGAAGTDIEAPTASAADTEIVVEPVPDLDAGTSLPVHFDFDLVDASSRSDTDSMKGLPRFVQSLWQMLRMPRFSHAITWADASGTSFRVNLGPLGSDVLPFFFRSNKETSFLRQLCFYSFMLVDGGRRRSGGGPVYSNPYFQRGRPDLLQMVQRTTREGSRAGQTAKSTLAHHAAGRTDTSDYPAEAAVRAGGSSYGPGGRLLTNGRYRGGKQAAASMAAEVVAAGVTLPHGMQWRNVFMMPSAHGTSSRQRVGAKRSRSETEAAAASFSSSGSSETDGDGSAPPLISNEDAVPIFQCHEDDASESAVNLPSLLLPPGYKKAWLSLPPAARAPLMSRVAAAVEGLLSVLEANAAPPLLRDSHEHDLCGGSGGVRRSQVRSPAGGVRADSAAETVGSGGSRYGLRSTASAAPVLEGDACPLELDAAAAHEDASVFMGAMAALAAAGPGSDSPRAAPGSGAASVLSARSPNHHSSRAEHFAPRASGLGNGSADVMARVHIVS